MKALIFSFLFISICTVFSQEIVKLPHNTIDGVTWTNPEKEYFSNIWMTQVVTNVSEPTMQVYRPTKESNTGTAVIIAPGGGLYAHSINSEGNEVAKWLAKKGITGFVLKYRLVPTGEDGVADITKLSQTNPQKIGEEVAKVMPYSIQDGLNAISHIRENALNYGIDPEKIGFMGFSAGGSVTMGVSYNYEEKNRPDFLVPVYAWTDAMAVQTPKEDAPPMLVVCATDDPLGLAKGSIDLYLSMFNAGKIVGLHMYSKGGHGFGMRKNGLPSDTWIERFHDWSIVEGITKVKIQ
ncbi:alpha/beta hydrolase [Croceitalea rosinachiae]|uniref:Alpha/beta hydrolase n=1 Tax=Croceitalea rosinachiae TaxID=3075596 RepID=A0ABU3AGP7_9FLAO|nr:alpha/beta hydrolase [Croceitalea sp. F388]MDT0608278.1 alpha/beta hydrolase [Croceitalea sp. F388]